MKVIPLALYLKERAEPPQFSAVTASIELPAFAPEPEDNSAAVEDAYSRGLEEGQRLAGAERDEALQAVEARHAAELAKERALWVAQQAQALAAQFETMKREVETAIADAAARLIEPIAIASARRASVEELRIAIKSLWEKEPGVTLRIAGPQDLLAALKTAMGEGAVAEFAVSESCEARIEAGDAVIETALASWARALAEVTK